MIPSLEDLSVLTIYPAGTIGEREELEAIKVLYLLCCQHGFGRVPQLAAQIEELWRDPSKVSAFAESKAKQLAWLKEARSAVQERQSHST